MAINAKKPSFWKDDIARSVDHFNEWFLRFAPKAFRETRRTTTGTIEDAFRITTDLTDITAETLRAHPEILPSLRMATCPPLARDRLMGLADASRNLIKCMEETGRLAPRMHKDDLQRNLERIAAVLAKMLDTDIAAWTYTKTRPNKDERHRAAIVIADRLCGALSNPIIRNAQEKRQLASIKIYLESKGYVLKLPDPAQHITLMAPGTFSFHTNLMVGDSRPVAIPIDAIVQPKKLARKSMPILLEAKSAGDFTNTNKRRKEEATKIRQLREKYGKKTKFILFLCGYFDSGYLGYEAAEGIDWVWEHRITDLEKLGI